MHSLPALEIGPGTGILTPFLKKFHADFKAVEIDRDSCDFLLEKGFLTEDTLIRGDFLGMNPADIFGEEFCIYGNFPYNISSQIMFWVWEHTGQIPAVAGMFQREVAQRLSSGPGSKNYGILSVLLQAFYDVEYLFTVDKSAFRPPPKVQSGVIRLTRQQVDIEGLDRSHFKALVKTAFNQRRKTLRNALRSLQIEDILLKFEAANKRAEQLTVAEFVAIAIESKKR